METQIKEHLDESNYALDSLRLASIHAYNSTQHIHEECRCGCISVLKLLNLGYRAKLLFRLLGQDMRCSRASTERKPAHKDSLALAY